MKYLALSLVVLGLVGAAAPAAAESWHPFSRSPNNVFMADVDSIAVNGDITTVRVVTAPRRGEPGDYSHSIETYEIKCATGEWRTAGVVEYGPNGVEADRYPEEGAAWEPVRPNTSPEFLNNIACKGSRAQPPVWATIKEFVDAGRP
ncbi:MAG: surface-adhesin E family protein [Brevundimonas sp.]